MFNAVHKVHTGTKLCFLCSNFTKTHYTTSNLFKKLDLKVQC